MIIKNSIKKVDLFVEPEIPSHGPLSLSREWVPSNPRKDTGDVVSIKDTFKFN